jgi:hypothetical protein
MVDAVTFLENITGEYIGKSKSKVLLVLSD